MSKFSFVHDKKQVVEHMHSALDGAFINLYTYGYTYWELDFVSKELDTNKFTASKILIPDPDQWWESFKKPPIDLKSKENDRNDTLSAMILTHSMNSLVKEWNIHPDNSLEIHFENKGVIIFPPENDINLGYSWSMRTEEYGKASICNCDEIYYRFKL
jgi:hypothetical protein